MKFVIIGGDAAGMSAASRAKRNMPELEVIVFEQSGDVSYSACGMPYNIADPDRDLDDLVVYQLDPRLWLPAPAQGIVAVQCRRGDTRVRAAVAELDHGPSRTAAAIERALLKTFEAGCHSAFGALAVPNDGGWSVRAGWQEGTQWHTADLAGPSRRLRATPRSDFTGEPADSGISPIEGTYPR